jgi:heme-degrading monooxygenase HmoA
MIIRVWRGQTTQENGATYARHVSTRVLPSLQGIAGHRGAYVLRRDAGGRTEFLVLTLWESLEAVREFAGEEVERAVVEQARAVLEEFDSIVRHYELLYDSVHPS